MTTLTVPASPVPGSPSASLLLLARLATVSPLFVRAVVRPHRFALGRWRPVRGASGRTEPIRIVTLRIGSDPGELERHGPPGTTGSRAADRFGSPVSSEPSIPLGRVLQSGQRLSGVTVP